MGIISEELFKLFVDEELISSLEESTLDVSVARQLPPYFYTSEEWFEYEKKAVFDRSWLCVGRADQVANTGDFFTITVNDDPLLVTRDAHRQVRVMSNVCQHRGHLLVEGEGSLERGLFRCPLHSWSYDPSGQLIHTPEMQKTQWDKTEWCLPQLKVELWHGFIFAHFDHGAPPLAPSLTRLAADMANYDVEHMVSIPTMDVPDYPWNWKGMLENAMEPYHNTYLHAGPHDFALGHGFCEFTLDENVIMHPTGFDRQDGAFNPIHKALLPPIETLSEEQRSRVMFAMVPPMLFLGLVSDHMFYFLVLPNGANKITLRIGLCFPPESMKVKNFEHIVKWIVDGIMIYNDQDVTANIAVQKGVRSKLKRRGVYSWKETTLQQFNQWLVKRYREYAEDTKLVAPPSDAPSRT